MKIALPIALLALGASSAAIAPRSPRTEDPQRWLQQLVGDWTGTSEATPWPGAEPVRGEHEEHVRSLGPWILSEGKGSSGGVAMSSLMTVGYDPKQQAVVGTWIDSVQTHLWSYRGSLDTAKGILTLEAEGPASADESKTTRYRDVVELKSADQKVLTSSVQQEDGTWITFLRAEYRRKK